MGVLFGPAAWWQSNLIAACPEGTILPDGSAIICKAGGTAWIVAPRNTEVQSQWAGGQYNSQIVGNKCCTSEWPGLESSAISYGLNPDDWFVPSSSQLQNPGYVCKSKWDCFCTVGSNGYWSSQDDSTNANRARYVRGSDGQLLCDVKSQSTYRVRLFRCVTY